MMMKDLLKERCNTVSVKNPTTLLPTETETEMGIVLLFFHRPKDTVLLLPLPPASSLHQIQKPDILCLKVSVKATLKMKIKNPWREFNMVKIQVNVKFPQIVFAMPISQVPPRMKSNPNNPLLCLSIKRGLDSNSQTLKIVNKT